MTEAKIKAVAPGCRIYVGDVLDSLRAMPPDSVHCCVTSPPYWALRDYGVDGQIGLEPTIQEYVAKLVEVFREVRRMTDKQKRTRQRPNDYTKRTGEEGTGNSCANTVAGVAVTTLGWEPTCKCEAGEPIPCTVLDPFLGSGTTGAVAFDLHRRFVGCELNPDYVKLAKRRIGEVIERTKLLDEPRTKEAVANG